MFWSIPHTNKIYCTSKHLLRAFFFYDKWNFDDFCQKFTKNIAKTLPEKYIIQDISLVDITFDTSTVQKQY